ncbi:MAG: phosphotransferase, partial [Xanthomonadales bacterium]|nr:phosphotransferase [Xanthomonadales bacterium]
EGWDVELALKRLAKRIGGTVAVLLIGMLCILSPQSRAADKAEAARLGLDRRNEQRVCEHVAAAGLAPQPLYFDPLAGIYMRRWEAGRSWSPTDLLEAANLRSLARVLRRLHRLPPLGKRFDPAAALRRYAAQTGTEEAAVLAQRAGLLLAELDRSRPDYCLCHNDLVSENILSRETVHGRDLWLIDWEYAALGDPLFDLAVVVQHHGLDPVRQRLFLEAYREGAVAAGDSERLQRQCDFYQCLLDLWTLRLQ